MAGKAERALTPAQLEIMEVIWSAGEAGVAEVWRAIGERRKVARNTVQTTLTRLHERGVLKARAEGNALLFSAARPRRSVLARMVGKLVDTAFAGSPSGLVAAIVESRRLSPDEAERIRRIIDDAEKRR
jgi:BlaI family penicillinase repressor